MTLVDGSVGWRWAVMAVDGWGCMKWARDGWGWMKWLHKACGWVHGDYLGLHILCMVINSGVTLRWA